MRPLIFAAALFALTASATAVAQDAAQTNRDCFASTQWRGWSAPGDGDALYLAVGMNDVYRIDLTPGSHVHRQGDQFLVNRNSGSGWVCSAVDLNLTLNDPYGGVVRPIVARSIRKLTPSEVEALPTADRPR